MDSASVLYRVAAAFFNRSGESKHAAHRAHINPISTSEILTPCPTARGGNTPYHPTEQKWILMGEIISIMDKLFR
jgi:hypothetical protein